MTETELKFQVPPAARPAVAAAMARGRSGRSRLQAVYFDTADRRLATHGIALRLRLEGDRWVQTAKAGDPHAMQRHEHNVPVDADPGGPPPALDLARHVGTAAGARIGHVLGDATVQPLYRTDILRTHREVRAGAGTLEYALDVGVIASGERTLDVHELEIELVDGSPVALLDAAACWVRRHGLWLDTRTKAERGDRLSRGVTLGTPAGARAPAGEGLQAAVACGLAHLLPNLSEVASGHFGPGHAAQLGAALDALVTALSRHPEADPAWAHELSAARADGAESPSLRAAPLQHTLLCLLAVANGQPGNVGCTTDPSDAA